MPKSSAKKLQRVKDWYYNNRSLVLSKTSNRRFELKKEVLTHYGKDGELSCCWSGCDIVDPDMLTLDHVNNDGNIERKTNRIMTGFRIYSKLKRSGFPVGYQTLCWNHQWKKQILRMRANVGS